jgi:hypothetical protein
MIRKIAVAVALVLTVVMAAAQTDAERKPEFPAKVDAQQAFAKLKALAGTWQQRSTKGWEGKSSIRVIARGSAVMMSNEFTDAPGEGMATLFFIDGERLLVTHYCEAGNQPTLAARGASADGRRIYFTLENATGIDKPSEGRMDALILTFGGTDSYSEQWTFRREGKQQWMEEIELRRAPAESASSGN